MLTDKSTRRVPAGPGGAAASGSQILEKIPESSFKKKSGDTQKAGEAGGDQTANKKDQFAKLSEDELNFMMDYRKLEDLEREKGIKFFECVGDPHGRAEGDDAFLRVLACCTCDETHV